MKLKWLANLDKYQLLTIVVSVFALVVSSILPIIEVYKNFIQGAQLNSSINQIILMRTSGENKQNLLQEMILDDLLSERPSKQALVIFSNYPSLNAPIQSRNRDKLKVELIDFTNGQLIYDPPEHLIEKYSEDKRFGSSFYIPLVVFNSGKKFAHVRSLIMIAESTSDSSKKWAFTVFVELNPEKLLDRRINLNDVERISKMFSGFSIGSGEGLKVNPWFIPIADANNKIISRDNIKLGMYKIRIFGYGAKDEILLEVPPVEYTLTKRNLLQSFIGIESAEYLHVEKHIDGALSRIHH